MIYFASDVQREYPAVTIGRSYILGAIDQPAHAMWPSVEADAVHVLWEVEFGTEGSTNLVLGQQAISWHVERPPGWSSWWWFDGWGFCTQAFYVSVCFFPREIVMKNNVSAKACVIYKECRGYGCDRYCHATRRL